MTHLLAVRVGEALSAHASFRAARRECEVFAHLCSPEPLSTRILLAKPLITRCENIPSHFSQLSPPSHFDVPVLDGEFCMQAFNGLTLAHTDAGCRGLRHVNPFLGFAMSSSLPLRAIQRGANQLGAGSARAGRERRPDENQILTNEPEMLLKTNKRDFPRGLEPSKSLKTSWLIIVIPVC